MTQPKIVQIAPMFNPQDNGKLAIYGLGDDGKVYFWSASEGVFKPNWMQPVAPANRQQKRAAGKGK